MDHSKGKGDEPKKEETEEEKRKRYEAQGARPKEGSPKKLPIKSKPPGPGPTKPLRQQCSKPDHPPQKPKPDLSKKRDNSPTKPQKPGTGPSKQGSPKKATSQTSAKHSPVKTQSKPQAKVPLKPTDKLSKPLPAISESASAPKKTPPKSQEGSVKTSSKSRESAPKRVMPPSSQECPTKKSPPKPKGEPVKNTPEKPKSEPPKKSAEKPKGGLPKKTPEKPKSGSPKKSPRSQEESRKKSQIKTARTEVTRLQEQQNPATPPSSPRGDKDLQSSDLQEPKAAAKGPEPKIPGPQSAQTGLTSSNTPEGAPLKENPKTTEDDGARPPTNLTFGTDSSLNRSTSLSLAFNDSYCTDPTSPVHPASDEALQRLGGATGGIRSAVLATSKSESSLLPLQRNVPARDPLPEQGQPLPPDNVVMSEMKVNEWTRHNDIFEPGNTPGSSMFDETMEQMEAANNPQGPGPSEELALSSMGAAAAPLRPDCSKRKSAQKETVKSSGDNLQQTPCSQSSSVSSPSTVIRGCSRALAEKGTSSQSSSGSKDTTTDSCSKDTATDSCSKDTTTDSCSKDTTSDSCSEDTTSDS